MHAPLSSLYVTENPGWIEVNILPASVKERERLLLDVVDPLVHGRLHGRIQEWHYFWEDEPIGMRHLRLRFLIDQDIAEDVVSDLAGYLDAAEQASQLWRWYPGDNGKPGDSYQGEAPGYGPEMWEVTYKDWTSGSELALALLKLDSKGQLTESRDYHAERRGHLHSNRLGMSYLEEGGLYTRLAAGYLANAGIGQSAAGAWSIGALQTIATAVQHAIEQNKPPAASEEES